MAAETQDLLTQDFASPAEAEQLAAMREGFGSSPHLEAAATFPEVVGDNNLLRFLRGNNHDVELATQKFTTMLQWREEQGANEVRRTMFEKAEAAGTGIDAYFDSTLLPHSDKVLRYYSERQYHGRDVSGNPVMITQNSFICHIDALMRNVTAQEFWEFRLARNELRAMLLERLSQEHGKLVKITFVWDLDGMALGYWKRLSSPAVKAYRRSFEESSRDHYPEIAYKVVAINVPWFINLLWKGIKTMLNPRTLAKISISDANYDDNLRAVVAVDQLPPHLHGDCETAPPGWRPDLVMVLGEGEGEQDEELGEPVTVAAGAHHREERPMHVGETAIWEYTVAAHDIGFRAVFTPSGGEDRVIESQEKVLSGGLQRGSWQAEEAGVLLLDWDNSYSRFRSKGIHVTVDLLQAPTEGDGGLPTPPSS